MDIWAKRKNDEWHSLLHHSLDVATIFEVLLENTLMGKRLNQTASFDLYDVCVYAFIHDAGKCHHGFQNKIKRQSGFHGNHLSPCIKNSHLKIIATHLFESDQRTDGVFLKKMLSTVFGHHGNPLQDTHDFIEEWNDEDKKRLHEMRVWIQALPYQNFSTPTNIKDERFYHLFNGILTLSDWIGSDETYFPYQGDKNVQSPMKVYNDSKKKALNAIEDLQLVSSSNEHINTSFENVFGFSPYDVQSKAASHNESAANLTILESATGTGKTEAALMHYANLKKRGAVDSLFFALPTRSAAKQIYDRVCEAIKNIQSVDTPSVHLAVPGYISVDGHAGEREGWSIRWNDDVHTLNDWASKSTHRYTTAPISVGTIDQVLMAGLRKNYAHMRYAGLSRSLIVIDEIHSSDEYMNSLLHKVLDMHHSIGGHSFLMSATMTEEMKSRFTGKEKSSHEVAINKPYPLITTGNGVEIPATVSDAKTKNVTWETNEFTDCEKIAKCANMHAENGARVLVIMNTVKRCQNVFEYLKYPLFTDNGMPMIHHSRFTAEDRKYLDAQIENAFGSDNNASEFVCVATQTVEQSLDIDADILITDLCPMDVLLQRIGRLHRHDNDRPTGYENASCMIACAENDSDQGISTIYNKKDCYSTRDCIEDVPVISIPDDSRKLIESTIGKTASVDRAKQVAGNIKAFDYFNDSFYELSFKPYLETRHGQSSILIRFDTPIQTPFEHSSTSVNVSRYLLGYFGHDDEFEGVIEKKTNASTETIIEIPNISVKLRYDNAGFYNITNNK